MALSMGYGVGKRFGGGSSGLSNWMKSKTRLKPNPRSGVVTAMNGTSPSLTTPAPTPANNANPVLFNTPPTLPDNFTYPQLANYEEERRRAFGTESEKAIMDRRTALENSLKSYAQNTLSLGRPDRMENLQTGGLLTSPSEYANAEARALQEITLATQPQLMDLETSATAARLQAYQDALDSGLSIRQAQLSADEAERAALQEEQLARDLASEQSRNSLYSSLIGTGGQLGSAYLMSKMLGGGAAAGGNATGALASVGANTGRTGIMNSVGGFMNKPIFGVNSATGASQAGTGAFYTGMGSTGAVPYAGAGAPASSVMGGNLGAVGTPGGAVGTPLAARMTVGRVLGGVGAGYLGAQAGRQVFKESGDLGATMGGGLGFIVGGPIGAGVGAFAGKAAEKYGEKASKFANKKFGKTAGSALKPIINPVGAVKSAAKAISNPAKAVKKIFCFAPGTLIEMQNGDKKMIKNLILGDNTKGGLVESLRISKVDTGDVYNYKGVDVTGYHAVLEDGKWIRIKDSGLSTKTDNNGVVLSIVTDKHRVYSNDIEFADEHETDDYENLSLDDSLKKLNENLVTSEVA